MLLSDMNNFERRISFQNILFGLEIEDLFATIFCGRKFSAEIYLTRSKFFWIKMAIFWPTDWRKRYDRNLGATFSRKAKLF
jgi:hypothetical protein